MSGISKTEVKSPLEWAGADCWWSAVLKYWDFAHNYYNWVFLIPLRSVNYVLSNNMYLWVTDNDNKWALKTYDKLLWNATNNLIPRLHLPYLTYLNQGRKKRESLGMRLDQQHGSNDVTSKNPWNYLETNWQEMLEDFWQGKKIKYSEIHSNIKCRVFCGADRRLKRKLGRKKFTGRDRDMERRCT